MRQMHVRPGQRQGVGRPVPPIRRLQHDLRVLTGLGDLRAQHLRRVGDPGLAQPLPIGRHPHQHRPSTVQVHSHDLLTVILCGHQRPPLSATDLV